jgi:hypothetical protein
MPVNKQNITLKGCHILSHKMMHVEALANITSQSPSLETSSSSYGTIRFIIMSTIAGHWTISFSYLHLVMISISFSINNIYLLVQSHPCPVCQTSLSLLHLLSRFKHISQSHHTIIHSTEHWCPELMNDNNHEQEITQRGRRNAHDNQIVSMPFNNPSLEWAK